MLPTNGHNRYCSTDNRKFNSVSNRPNPIAGFKSGPASITFFVVLSYYYQLVINVSSVVVVGGAVAV